MREENLASKKRMGEINAEIETLKSELETVHKSLTKAKENADRFSAEAIEYHKKHKETQGINSFLQSSIEKSNNEVAILTAHCKEIEMHLKNSTNIVEKFTQEKSILEAKLKDSAQIINSLENELIKFKKNSEENYIRPDNFPKITWRGSSDDKNE